MGDTLVGSHFDRSNRFELTAWLLMAVTVVLIALVIWRGDQVGLRVVTIAPAPEAAGISPRTQLRIRFDQPLDADAMDATAVTLIPAVAGEVRTEGDTLVFAPAAAFDPNTAYTVELAPAAVQSVQGRVLREAVRWQFQTGHTSIVYSQLDAENREQLMMAAVTLPAAGEGGAVQVASPTALTAADFGIWDFGVNPNSGQIVFSVLTEAGTSDLWTLLPGAQEPTLLFACPEAACSSVAFSPNSQLLAFSQRNASGFGVPVVSPPRLYLLELTTGEVAPIFADSQQLAFDPRWSPDGAWLSYLSPDLGGVGVYHLQNGTTRFYPTTTGEAAVWHPQRNELILSEMLTSEAYFEVHLLLIDPLTETRQDLSVLAQTGESYPVEDNSPAYSPDGAWVAFRRKELAGPRTSLGKQLWIMAADGSDARPLTQEPDFDHGPATWSPDGRYLLYHRFPLRGPDVTISVWAMDVASGERWEVARPGQRPQWVP